MKEPTQHLHSLEMVQMQAEWHEDAQRQNYCNDMSGNLAQQQHIGKRHSALFFSWFVAKIREIAGRESQNWTL